MVKLATEFDDIQNSVPTFQAFVNPRDGSDILAEVAVKNWFDAHRLARLTSPYSLEN
jgi:hypothetical protein